MYEGKKKKRNAYRTHVGFGPVLNHPLKVVPCARVSQWQPAPCALFAATIALSVKWCSAVLACYDDNHDARPGYAHFTMTTT